MLLYAPMLSASWVDLVVSCKCCTLSCTRYCCMARSLVFNSNNFGKCFGTYIVIVSACVQTT